MSHCTEIQSVRQRVKSKETFIHCKFTNWNTVIRRKETPTQQLNRLLDKKLTETESLYTQKTKKLINKTHLNRIFKSFRNHGDKQAGTVTELINNLESWPRNTDMNRKTDQRQTQNVTLCQIYNVNNCGTASSLSMWKGSIKNGKYWSISVDHYWAVCSSQVQFRWWCPVFT